MHGLLAESCRTGSPEPPVGGGSMTTKFGKHLCSVLSNT